MKTFRSILSTAVWISILLSPIYGQELDGHLKLLEPFTHNRWEATFELPGMGTVTMHYEWEIILNGKAIRSKTDSERIDFHSESFFYWDSDAQKIGLFSISNRNNFIHGFVEEDNGKIVMYGHVTFPDNKLKFKNIFEFTEDGKLLDKWFRFEDGQWQAGHSRALCKIQE